MSPPSWSGVSLESFVVSLIALLLCLRVILKKPAFIPSDDCIQPFAILLDSLQKVSANFPPVLQFVMNEILLHSLCTNFLHPQIFHQNQFHGLYVDIQFIYNYFDSKVLIISHFSP
jgi:hypothetical protein